MKTNREIKRYFFNRGAARVFGVSKKGDMIRGFTRIDCWLGLAFDSNNCPTKVELCDGRCRGQQEETDAATIAANLVEVEPHNDCILLLEDV